MLCHRDGKYLIESRRWCEGDLEGTETIMGRHQGRGSSLRVSIYLSKENNDADTLTQTLKRLGL